MFAAAPEGAAATGSSPAPFLGMAGLFAQLGVEVPNVYTQSQKGATLSKSDATSKQGEAASASVQGVEGVQTDGKKPRVARSLIARRCPPSVPNKCTDIMETISLFRKRLHNAFPFSELLLCMQQ